ncbi:MAG: fibronectin type III domain-containing protein [Candidatus Eisenbacteria sp.]|nr:fibronectin type III domain-containing protein [Candidatus Eisenbacteria bacterium]
MRISEGFCVIVLAWLVLSISACDDDSDLPPDIAAPAAVTDLRVTAVSDSSAVLAWTAPGDNGMDGQASTYDIRYSANSDSLQAWADSSTIVVAVPNAPPPSSPGSTDTVRISGLMPITMYYFALKTADEASNFSDLSNIADTLTTGNWPPAACISADPMTGVYGTLFTFDAACTDDPDDPLASLLFQWDWQGDGTFDEEATGDPNAVHQFAGPGTHRVILRVTDPRGASDSDSVEVYQSPFALRDSPENVLHNLKMAYAERAVAEYESLLAMDFTFLLSAEDAAEPGMPESWGRQDEIGIHTNMFDYDRVQTLTLGFDSGDRVFDPTDGLWTITITNVRLRLYGETPGNEGEGPVEYKVDNGTSKFWFRENDWTEPGTESDVWTIVKWKDQPIRPMSLSQEDPLPADGASWGTIKAVFR